MKFKKGIRKITYLGQYIYIAIDIIMICSLVLYWNDLSFLDRVARFFVLALTFHMMEESRFPGGFVWMFNTMRGEGTMNRMNWFLVDCVAAVFSALVALLFMNRWPVLILFFAFFGLAELCTHTATGVTFFKKFFAKGKDTIYVPGTGSCWLMFVPIALLIILYSAMNHVFTPLQWILGVVITVVFFVLVVLLPENVIKDKDSVFAFDIELPGYFSKFLDE